MARRISYLYRAVFFLGLLFITIHCNAQQLQFLPTIGISWRSTPMNFFNLKPIEPLDATVPYNYEKNIQGFGLNIGAEVKHLSGFSIEYFPSLRYDVTLINTSKDDRYYKGFIFDHNIAFKQKITEKLAVGGGVSLVNANLNIGFINKFTRYIDLKFTTYNLLVEFPIKDILNVNILAMYIPKDMPENPDNRYIAYSLRLFRRISFRDRDN